MLLRLPQSIRYPVTITEFHLHAQDEVKELSPLLSYTYQQTVTEDNDDGIEIQVTKQFPGTWEAPIEGKIVKWFVRVGAIIQSAGFVFISSYNQSTTDFGAASM